MLILELACYAPSENYEVVNAFNARFKIIHKIADATDINPQSIK